MITLERRLAGTVRSLAGAALVLGLTCAPAGAGVLLDVGGANQAFSLQAGQAAAVSFTLGATATDLSISAPILCLGCTGAMWLQKDAIGPTASFAGAIDAHAFTGATSQPWFTIASLGPGLYFFLVSLDTSSTGAALWSGSTSGALTVTGNGATRGLDFLAQSTTTFVPFSEFGVDFGQNLNFTVSSAGVPEPTGWALMILGAGLAGVALRRRTAGAVT
ncbi:PEPxxWA-CTERM sorting domain-containing protein [Phenylobacterium sp.]|jgi:hypothetical protein|uniref:PEPxxWA-CTERM sorting domain-containing protein n=1 Tax=Phenylobacterium sp. TaxID=1871053 RepID=UPI0037CB8B00